MSATDFGQWIDAGILASQSIVRRYRSALGCESSADTAAALRLAAEQTSIREGARIVPFWEERGVQVDLLDETSLMHTGSLKSVDGCVSSAFVRLAGASRVVFESGGNTGTALTEYCNRAGVETFLFVPEDNLRLLASRSFRHPLAHLASCAEPGLNKEAAQRFAGLIGALKIPRRPWRHEASRLRGLFILEQMQLNGRYDWFVQTISAAFGPIGIYDALEKFGGGAPRPRFLGVQQRANCPMFSAWRGGSAQQNGDEKSPLLARVMYDRRPETHGTWSDLAAILERVGGELTTVDGAEFAALISRRFGAEGVIELLARRGVRITRDGEAVVEPAGLISLAGLIKAIDLGVIPARSRVLWSLTGGATPADGQVQPEWRVRDLDDVRRFAETVVGR